VIQETPMSIADTLEDVKDMLTAVEEGAVP